LLVDRFQNTNPAVFVGFTACAVYTKVAAQQNRQLMVGIEFTSQIHIYAHVFSPFRLLLSTQAVRSILVHPKQKQRVCQRGEKNETMGILIKYQ
jgi:hypothetical protein